MCFFNELTQQVAHWHVQTAILVGAVLVLGISVGIVLHKTNHLTLSNYTKLTTTVWMLLIAIPLFRLVNLHFALTLWTLLYGIIGITENKNRFVRYLAKVPPESLTRQNLLKKRVLQKPLTKEICASFRFSKEELAALKRDGVWKKSFLPFRYYMLGFIFPSVDALWHGTQYVGTHSIVAIVFECYVVIATAAYWVYPLIEYGVANIETSLWFGSKKTATVCYVGFVAVVGFVITGIIWYGYA